MRSEPAEPGLIAAALAIDIGLARMYGVALHETEAVAERDAAGFNAEGRHHAALRRGGKHWLFHAD